MGKIRQGVRAPLAPEEAVDKRDDALAASIALHPELRVWGPLCGAADQPRERRRDIEA
jgi:hypothetical protein